MSAEVIAVSAKPKHGVNKANRPVIKLLAGEGVEGDAHCGATVKHRSRWRRDPTQPNIRQVHLLHAELFEYLAVQGFSVTPGLMGENITKWLKDNLPTVELVDRTVTQSSDKEFHCLTITLFYKAK